MIQWSGQNWYQHSGQLAPTIVVIDATKESYDQYHERMMREEGAEHVPFGFSRALLQKDKPKRKPKPKPKRKAKKGTGS